MSEKKSNVTGIVINKQYPTYQILLEVHPQNGFSVDDCFSKVILYVMNWHLARLREGGNLDESVLDPIESQYPEVAKYKDFMISETEDIKDLLGDDFRTSYMPRKNAWVFNLDETNNEKDNSEVRGRRFTTNICVYKKEKTVILGVKIMCREPATNKDEDPTPFRPGFLKTINDTDEDIIFTEAGVPMEYAIGREPIILNGRSGEQCKKINQYFLENPGRQLPVIIIPCTFYGDNRDEINRLTRSFLGHAYIVILENADAKLFINEMNAPELLEASQNGRVIIYRSNKALGIQKESLFYEVRYVLEAEEIRDTHPVAIGENDLLAKYDVDGELFAQAANARFEKALEDNAAQNKAAIETISAFVKNKEHIRKKYDFGEYSFVADSWNPTKQILSQLASMKDDAIETAIREQAVEYEATIGELQNDIDGLQETINKLTTENNAFRKQMAQDFGSIERLKLDNEKLTSEVVSLEAEVGKKRDRAHSAENAMAILRSTIYEELRPITNLPPLTSRDKDAILAWIEEYYSEELIIHKKAVDSFEADNRNIDFRMFCLMIHYIAGWTRHRNAGEDITCENLLRYDVERNNFDVSRVSVGSGGSIDMRESAYKMNIRQYDPEYREVIMDMHVTYGVRAENLIRIYFYYDANIKKTIIGYMPDHLPTRRDGH